MCQSIRQFRRKCFILGSTPHNLLRINKNIIKYWFYYNLNNFKIFEEPLENVWCQKQRGTWDGPHQRKKNFPIK